MSGSQAILLAFAMFVVLTTLWVAARSIAVALYSFRASRIISGLVALMTGLLQVVLFTGVAAYWFIYAVAHGPKSYETDLNAVVLTGFPFVIISYGLHYLLRVLRRKELEARRVEPARP